MFQTCPTTLWASLPHRNKNIFLPQESISAISLHFHILRPLLTLFLDQNIQSSLVRPKFTTIMFPRLGSSPFRDYFKQLSSQFRANFESISNQPQIYFKATFSHFLPQIQVNSELLSSHFHVNFKSTLSQIRVTFKLNSSYPPGQFQVNF